MLALICYALIFAVMGGAAGYLPAAYANDKQQEAHQQQEFYEVVYYETMSYLFFATTLEELKSRTTHIVRGRIADNATTVLLYNFEYDPPRPSLHHTIVTFEIYEVIKGNLTVGETIKIREPYYIRDRILTMRFNYMPSIPHQEYIFFLTNQTTPDRIVPGHEKIVHTFLVVQGVNGRFLVPDFGDGYVDLQTFTAEDLSLGSSGGRFNIDLHRRLWQEVIDAYMN
jgi:hypothetical protein